MSGNGAALLTTLGAAPGEVRTELMDLDFKTRTGRTLPVRLFHKVAFGADGTPGASRTLVISRARDEHSDPERAAEVRFMRFFDHTPMAIATVDRGGNVVGANARYAKLAQGLNSDGGAAKSIFRAVNPRDRGLLIAAINQAAEGQGDIAPVEVMLDAVLARAGELAGRRADDHDPRCRRRRGAACHHARRGPGDQRRALARRGRLTTARESASGGDLTARRPHVRQTRARWPRRKVLPRTSSWRADPAPESPS